MFARLQRSVTSKAGLAAMLLLLLVGTLGSFWSTRALADSLGPQQNISNDSTQDLAPAIAQDPSGNLHAIWDGGSGGSHVVNYSKGVWNGSGYVFGPSTTIVGVGGYGYATPSIAVSPNGTVMASWSESGANLRVQTWNSSQSQPSGTPVTIMPGIQSSISADNANRFHIVANGNFSVQYCQFENGTCTDQESFSPQQSNRPHVAADSNGNVHVVWDRNQGVLYRSRPAGGAFGNIETLDSGGNYASIAPDGIGNVHIVWSSNFIIQYCQRTYGTPCTNQHSFQAGNSDLAPSVGASPAGVPFVTFRDSQDSLLWYDTRENGTWGGSRTLANPGPTNPFVSAHPYSNRFSVVWSYNYQIQEVFDTVSGSTPPTPSPTPPPATPPVISSLTLNNGSTYTTAQLSVHITNTGGAATSYTITVGGQTATGALPAPDAGGGYTIPITLPTPPTGTACVPTTVSAVLIGPAGQSNQASASISYDPGVQATVTAVNPHLASDGRPVGLVSTQGVVTNYGATAFTRDPNVLVYIDAGSGECSGLTALFVGKSTDTVSGPSDPRFRPYTNGVAYVEDLHNLGTIVDGQTYTFNVFLRDAAGNVAAFPATITYDVTPPAVTVGSNPVPTTATGSGNDIAQLNLSGVQVTDTTYQKVTGQPYWGVSVVVTGQPTIDLGDPAWDQYGVVDPGVVGGTLNWNLYFGNGTRTTGTPLYVHVRFVDGAGNVSSTVVNSGPVTPRAYTSRALQLLPYISK